MCETVFDTLLRPSEFGKYFAFENELRYIQRIFGNPVIDGAHKKLWFWRLPKYVTVPLVGVDKTKIWLN